LTIFQNPSEFGYNLILIISLEVELLKITQGWKNSTNSKKWNMALRHWWSH